MLRLFKFIHLRFYFFLLASIWLTAVFLFNPHYVYIYSLLEEWLAAHGMVWFRDFEAYNLPLSRILSLGLYLLTNWNLKIEPFLALVLGVSSLFVIYKIGEKYLSVFATLISLIFFAFYFWYTATGVIYFHEILIGFLIAIDIFLILKIYYQKKPTTKQLISCGFFLFLTVFSSQLSAVTVATLLITGTYILINKKLSKQDVLNNYLIFLVSFIFPFIILSAYFLLNNSFLDFFSSNVIYYLQYASFDKNMGRDLSRLPKLQLIFYYLPLLLLIASSIMLKISTKQLTFERVFTALIAVSSIPFIIFSVYHPHHLNYALPALALTAGFSFDLKFKQKHLGKLFFGVCSAAFLYFFISVILQNHLNKFIFPPSLKIYNDIPTVTDNPVDQSELDAILWLRQYTKDSERIIVFGDPLIYIKSGRLPAIKQSIGLPHSWLPIPKIRKELADHPSNYWVIDQVFVKRVNESYQKPEMVNLVSDQLKAYEKVADFTYWQIWAKKD